MRNWWTCSTRHATPFCARRRGQAWFTGGAADDLDQRRIGRLARLAGTAYRLQDPAPDLESHAGILSGRGGLSDREHGPPALGAGGLFGDQPNPLGDRESAALCAGCDDGGRCLPGSDRFGPANPRWRPQFGAGPAAPRRLDQHRRRVATPCRESLQGAETHRNHLELKDPEPPPTTLALPNPLPITPPTPPAKT